MYIDKHTEKWDKLHESHTFRPEYPTESVIRFVRMNFPEADGKSMLDLGCGAGRHVIFLAQEGFSVTGIDFSKTGLQYAKKRLEDHGLNAVLTEGSILSLPYEDDSFDGIVSYGVLCYFKYDDLKTVAKEIYRTLKKDGKAFLITRSTHDKRFGKGINIEKNTFKMNSNITNEQDLLIHFLDMEEISDLFSSFSSIHVGFTEESLNSLTEYNSDYLITLTK